MFSRNLFHHRQFTFVRFVGACGLLFIVALAMVNAVTHRSHAAARQQLTFEDRVAAQRAIEEVYYRHRIWPTDNPQPKPPLDAVLTEEALRVQSAKVYLEREQTELFNTKGQRIKGSKEEKRKELASVLLPL